jgi:hypothetical protein
MFKCKLKETQHCNLGNETKETILHLFWECNIVKILWLEMVDILRFNICITPDPGGFCPKIYKSRCNT